MNNQAYPNKQHNDKPHNAPNHTSNKTSNSTPKHTSIAPSPIAGSPKPTKSIDDLLMLMSRLRADCPWDRKQTNHSLIPYVIEEAYELAEAIQAHDSSHITNPDNSNVSIDTEDIKSELGDVLLQVVFHSQLYAEQNAFNFGDVIYTLQDKLIRRHPHVFETDSLPDEAAVKKRWDEIKAMEEAAKISRGKPKRQLDSVKAGSALMQAQNLQKAASKLGFDWAGVTGAIEKLEEEINELKAAILLSSSKEGPADLNGKQDANHEPQNNARELEKELGDCMFGLVNVARKLNIDAEAATLTCVHKFRSRFGFIEMKLAEQGLTPETSNIEEMDRLWELAKSYE